MKCFMIRSLSGLTPDPQDERSGDAIRGLGIGEVVHVEIIKPRNIHHHRLYWALVSKLAAGLGVAPETVSNVLKIRTGHYVTVESKTGPLKFPKSISFAAMDQTAFRVFFDRCCREICFEWLPHMTGAQLRTEVLQMMGITWDENDETRRLDSAGGRDRGATRDGEKPHKEAKEVGGRTPHAV